MENPRTGIPGEWAPPPPIVVTTPPPAAAPPARLRPEEEFEATLGSLVEHFTTLPPPAFGEAPELAAAPARDARPRRRSTALVWVGSLVLGATVAGGVMLGLQLAKPAVVREAPAAAVIPAAPPAPKIVIKSLPDDPPPATEKSAPLADDGAALAEEHTAAEPVAKAAAPDRKPRKATVRKRSRTRPAAGSSGPKLPASTGGDGWEDPYK